MILFGGSEVNLRDTKNDVWRLQLPFDTWAQDSYTGSVVARAGSSAIVNGGMNAVLSYFLRRIHIVCR